MYCVHCGKPPAEGDHLPCRGGRAALEPPRFCADCGRRMVVQITPTGWSANCSRHGVLTNAGVPAPTD